MLLKLAASRLVTSLAIVTVYAAGPVALAQSDLSFPDAQTFLKKYCQGCHEGKTPAGGFALRRVSAKESFGTEAQKWTSLARRVHDGEMPPKGSPAPDLDERERFAEWVKAGLRVEACASGIVPGPAPARRLNRDEYSATIRDLLDMHVDIGQSLPADGAGGEGFDNAAETLFLSPLHSEKYMEVAKFVMDFAAREFKPRAKILIVKPGPGVTADRAARQIFEAFLPRAFRRPVQPADVMTYMELFRAARKQGETFEAAIFFSLRSALVSPMFLFRTEPANHTGAVRPVDQYALASRLSYFLWGSMPDEFLWDIAEMGKLNDPAVLHEVIGRMIRNDRSLQFTQRFVEQWLRTRDLSGDKAPDAKLYPLYASSDELRADIRFQPVLFLRELLLRNLSLLNLIDSKQTIGTSSLSRLFGFKFTSPRNANQQPAWLDLPEGSKRGGLLGMPAVLAVSSHPYRTSPVLRGAWILDSLLGTPPPPPPANVPPLEEAGEGAAPKSMRERLTQHRANPVCASCHSRIDPMGFALENYDVLGRWRDEDAGKPVDNTGELIDGTKVEGPDGLRKVLFERKDLLIRNLTTKMLGYALGRGLTLKDSCTVDEIVAKLKDNDYSAMTLIEGVVMSVPFRYQAPLPRQQSVRPPTPPVKPATQHRQGVSQQ